MCSMRQHATVSVRVMSQRWTIAEISPNPANDATLTEPWTAYRTWAATARYHKSAIDFWSLWSLRLAIAGAVLATLGQQLMPLAPKDGSVWTLYRIPGFLGAAMIALATYFSSQALAGNREKVWIRSRSAAESLKSAIFLYRASVRPYDAADRGAQFRLRVEEILKQVSNIPPRQPPTEAAPVLDQLNVDQYITARVDGAVNWYRNRALEYQKKSDRLRTYTFVLGAIAVLLGLVSAFNAVSAWLAVIATITTSLTAFAKNQRYQTLLALYSATASRLGLLKGEWAQSGRTEHDKSDRDSFIQNCEQTMALENGSWMAQWSEEQSGQGGSPKTNVPD